jgi:glucosamine--fructose-6-phosphate aminotransferase (isomerizing)
MCGIVGAVYKPGERVAGLLLDGLLRLEYRGYDSAGVALRNGALTRARVAGRVGELAKIAANLPGHIGVGHTRWATHGAPAQRNAHPLMSGEGENSIAVVHNGIIENHAKLRRELRAAGFVFTSDTDTEVIAHLIARETARGRDIFAAMRVAASRLQGAFAVAALAGGGEDAIVCARRGSPLLIGTGEGGMHIASDAPALAGRAKELIRLEDGDCAILNQSAAEICDAKGADAKRPARRLDAAAAVLALGEYRHFMQKEIFEQPDAVAATAASALERDFSPALFGRGAGDIFRRAKAAYLPACGTSYHAAQIGAMWMEDLAKVPCSARIAGEFRDRPPCAPPPSLYVGVSQSGETADTLAAMRALACSSSAMKMAICNTEHSSLARECELSFLTRAGVEIGVAATKTFAAQLSALYILSAAAAKARKCLSADKQAQITAALRRAPPAMRRALECEEKIRRWAREIAESKHALFLGRGAHYPLALEGALKLKEISYIHAEGYPAGELKHGPLALVDREMPVIALAPDGARLAKIQSNLSEVAARGGRLYVIAGQKFRMKGAQIIRLKEEADDALSPLIYAPPLQLLAYHAAREKGTDIDKPRNLAKSVTVE